MGPHCSHSHTLHLDTKPLNTQSFIEVLCFIKGHPDRFFFYSGRKFNDLQHDIKGRTQWAAILSPHCKYLNVDQAGFCKGHSTGEQVLALTAYIENGLESKFKTEAGFSHQPTLWSGIKASYWNSGNCSLLGQWPAAKVCLISGGSEYALDKINLMKNAEKWLIYLSNPVPTYTQN